MLGLLVFLYKTRSKDYIARESGPKVGRCVNHAGGDTMWWGEVRDCLAASVPRALECPAQPGLWSEWEWREQTCTILRPSTGLCSRPFPLAVPPRPCLPGANDGLVVSRRTLGAAATRTVIASVDGDSDDAAFRQIG